MGVGAPKGHPKWGGRKKGSVNKRTSVLEKCEALGLDPFAELARIGNDPIDPNRFNALKELCQYLEPKKKAVEHSGAIDLNAQRELESLMGMTEEQLVEIIRKEVGKK